MMMRALVLAALLCAAAATCPAGYEDIDSVCTDIDECQLGTTNCNVRHSPRFARGVCRASFRDGGPSSDLGAASLMPRSLIVQVLAYCNNTAGSYTCQVLALPRHCAERHVA